MLRIHKISSLGLSTLLFAGLAVVANADVTATQTQSVPLTNTNVNTNFTFNKFDTTLGTLSSITIDLNGTAVATGTITNVTSAGNFEFDSSTTTTLSRPGGVVTLITVLPFQAEFKTLTGPSDPALPYSYPTNSGTADSGAVVFSGGSDLTLFSGTPGSTILLPFSARGTSGISGPGTITSQVSTKGSGFATLFYTYTPASTTTTPEPGTWAMLVAGASTGLVALRRRRRSMK